jgi:predicted Rossmann fold nucleotide-binding protein DprA/Smf involved in DNA uptake
MRLPKEYKGHLDQGRLLLLSPFPEKLRRATVETALSRNYVLAALADRIFVPYAAPSSKTFEFCRVLVSWHKPLYTLANDANTGLLALGGRPLNGPGAASRLVEG